MAETHREIEETTYPLRTAARMTGLSPELLRAWERRYEAVVPIRTPGGTRRYRASDLERLRLLKSAVDAGHRISQVAGLDISELRERAETPQEAAMTGHLDDILRALDDLDGHEAQRLLSQQFSALGPLRFAKELAIPLVHEVGQRWADDRMGIASEHLGTHVLRSILGAALVPSASALFGPRVIFATPSGQRHELGLQVAALTAMGAGANPIYLGAELPVEDMLAAVERSDAAALALSIVSPPDAREERAIAALRGGLPKEIRFWIGGAGARGMEFPAGVEPIEDLGEFEQSVALLASESGGFR